jgi:hypothetical protein
MTISLEAKQVIASALYRDARGWEERLDPSTALQCKNVCIDLVCALVELGLDTEEMRWVHDRIDDIATKADRMLQEAAANA